MAREKSNRKYPVWKGGSKTVFISRWQDSAGSNLMEFTEKMVKLKRKFNTVSKERSLYKEMLFLCTASKKSELKF